MKSRTIFSFIILVAFSLSAIATNIINLTPWPKNIKEGVGEYLFPSTYTVGGENLPDSVSAEIQKFTSDFNKASTGCTATIGTGNNCNISVVLVPSSNGNSFGTEGYRLTVSTEGVKIESNTATGIYYAFVTIKKMLPACISIGVKDDSIKQYALPCVTINDSPTYGYRGFMLDCARHFFDVSEIKRMIDIMAVYKLNRFHWHLTDDQGWRAEIKKYPKLTTIGATASNCWLTDLHQGTYWTNRTYGPFFYSQEQMREVVAYAKARHIEVVPEIEFPGHAVAALAAYPEFSCNPDKVEPLWITGGVSTHVLNVGNPKAIQFVKDILTEIMDIFPYELIHIGGDECPTNAWQNNAQCQALYGQLNLSHYRALQSHFNKQVADFVGQHGRRIATWNESIDCEGADTELMKTTNAAIWCWTNAYGNARRAAKMGLDAMLTPWTRGYINRAQSNDPIERTLPGDGSDNVKNVYEINPMEGDVPAGLRKHYMGVQGTFWTEHIGTPDMMEHIALPRLLCIAEVGWTPYENKDFSAFQKRLTADTLIFNYGDYEYGKHFIIGYKGNETAATNIALKMSKGKKAAYYRIVSCAGTPRAGRCWELVHKNSPLLGKYADKSIAPNRLWSNTKAEKGSANYDWQMWRLEEDKTQNGHYALVCKALPNGSLCPKATSQDANSRFMYDPNHKYYDFVITSNNSHANQNAVIATIASTKHKGLFLNTSMEKQGFAVNLYNSPGDGNSGYWAFVPEKAGQATRSAGEIIKEAQNIVKYGKPYGKQPQLGQYSASSLEALKKLFAKVDGFKTMNEKKKTIFTTKLEARIIAAKLSLGQLKQGKSYRFRCAIEGFNHTVIYDDGKSDYIQHTSAPKPSSDRWIITKVSNTKDGNQYVHLQNAATQRFIGSNTEQQRRAMWPISAENEGKDIVVSFNPEHGDYTLADNGKNIFPLSPTAPTLPGVLSSGNCNYGAKTFLQAVRLQGAAWSIEEIVSK